MTAVVVSDIHIGAHLFERDRFVSFLEKLPADTELILNGDTLHVPPEQLAEDDARVFSLLVQESEKRPVTWVYGNHDLPFEVKPAGSIVFKHEHTIGKELCIAHGDAFMPAPRLLHFLATLIRPFRIKIGGDPVLSARVIQKVPPLFRFLADSVMRNATAYAAKEGFRAITCGHVHEVMDTERNGTRYLNTGTWTEWPAFCLVVSDEGMSVEQGDSRLL